MGTQYPVFKTTNFDIAVDSAGREDSSIKNRLAALHDIEFAIGQQRNRQPQDCTGMPVSVPIVNRRVVDFRWQLAVSRVRSETDPPGSANLDRPFLFESGRCVWREPPQTCPGRPF